MESTQILETASDSSSFTSWLVQKVRGLPGQRVLFNDIMSIYNTNTDPDSQNCSVYPLLDSTEMKWNRKYWPSGEKEEKDQPMDEDWIGQPSAATGSDAVDKKEKQE